MTKLISPSGWMLLILSAAVLSSEAAIADGNHFYLGYLSPFKFINGYNRNAASYIFNPLRSKRSVGLFQYPTNQQGQQSSGLTPNTPYPSMSQSLPPLLPSMYPMSYQRQMSYPYNPSYTNIFNPFQNFHYPEMPFPSMISGFNPMRYFSTNLFNYPSSRSMRSMSYADTNMHYPQKSYDSSSYFKSMYPSSPAQPSKHVQPSFPSFDDKFMRMMGFSFKKPTTPSYPSFTTDFPKMNSVSTQGYNSLFSANSYDMSTPMYSKFNFPKRDTTTHSYDSFNFPKMDVFSSNSGFNPPKMDNMGFNHGAFDFPKMGSVAYPDSDKNVDMAYSSSYTMNMDYKNGKGHMMTKDSSYKNDNGRVEVHKSPERHFTLFNSGKVLPDNNYQNMH